MDVQKQWETFPVGWSGGPSAALTAISLLNYLPAKGDSVTSIQVTLRENKRVKMRLRHSLLNECFLVQEKGCTEGIFSSSVHVMYIWFVFRGLLQ